MIRADSIEIAIIGGTFAGNKGAAGMLESTIFNLDKMLGEKAFFHVLSVYPSRDSRKGIPARCRIVPAPPLRLILILPVLSLIYALLGKLRLPRRFLHSFAPLGAIARSEIVLDVSGISYVDGRLATLAYNLACNLPAILLGTKLIKLSQAIGPLEGKLNRFAAERILKRCQRIFTRGDRTTQHLEKLGLKNLAPAADLAFILNDNHPLPDTVAALDLPSGTGPVIGVSPSQVLDNYCRERGKDLTSILARYLADFRDKGGARILIIAHSLLEPAKRSRNNDYHICKNLHQALGGGPDVSLIVEDLNPSELRAVISRCDIYLACRFHSMISALCVNVPCLVPAWSHKYREVMAVLGLDNYVIDLEGLTSENLTSSTREILAKADEIRSRMEQGLPAIKDSARSQLIYVRDLLDKGMISGDLPLRTGKRAQKLYDLFYRDLFDRAFLGYSSDPSIREGAASGGLVSSLLIDQLEKGKVDGVIACRTGTESGRLDFYTVTCNGSNEVLDCRTSIYSDFDHAGRILDILRENDKVFAVVALPCQWSMLNNYLDKNPALKKRVGLKIGLWCGHATDRRLIDDFLSCRGVEPGDIEEFHYRKGLWRGETVIKLRGGGEKRISFRKGYGLLQNLYADCKKRCFSCPDHFGRGSDLSFGDAWLSELKSKRIKYSMAVPLTARGGESLRDLAGSGRAILREISPVLAVRAQKRAVIWHTYGSAGRSTIGGLFGLKIPRRGRVRARWNDLLSAFLILVAWKAFSGPLRPLLMRLPWPAHYPWMLVQKFFLNF
ncbi:MAG: polysaccharide pyruvyl transferase family protein [Candidatus Krumholzibacteriota bacterium]|nr:polysaccharide pyruvyl transferase family protein [Candidatus Krumholzibacteriota bacterium]